MRFALFSAPEMLAQRCRILHANRPQALNLAPGVQHRSWRCSTRSQLAPSVCSQQRLHGSVHGTAVCDATQPSTSKQEETRVEHAKEQGVQEEELTSEQAALNDFLVWLVANDVHGIGLEDSKVGLYCDESGERGLMALQPVSKGEVLLRVPMRLAITDHAEDEESNRLMYEDAPWSVRLATKLLRERGKGRASAWFPYLQVLPACVPSPLEAFSWEDMQQVEWQPAQAAIYEANWLVTDAYNRAAGSSPDAGDAAALEAALKDAQGESWMVPETQRIGSPAPTSDQISEVLGGASSEAFQWAMAVVHSRTFANAARGGGVGVRMLMPLVDMINHGGDVTASGLMDDLDIIATDNVRWDLIPPQQSPNGWWEMAVSSTRDITPGQPLVLSYGERSSDDFFVHYGFVPPLCNPHEDAVLFENAEEALEWHYEQYSADLGMGGAEDMYTQAYTATIQEQRLSVWSQRQEASPGPQFPTGLSMASADGELGPGDAERSPGPSKAGGGQMPKGWEKLKVYAGGRVDPALMTAFSLAACGDTRAAELAIARRAQQLLSGMPTPVLHDLYYLLADARMQGDAEGAEVLGRLMLAQAELQRKHDAFLNSAVSEAAAAEVGTSGRGVSAPAGLFSTVPEGSSLEELMAGLQQEVDAKQGGVATPLTCNARLCITYRASKKLVLWGVVARVAAAGDEPGALTQQQSQELPLGSVRAAGWAQGRTPTIPRNLQ